jgi:phage minor structural protein
MVDYMKPILFTENSTDFTTNGIGRLSDAISCVVREERNGQYELEMVYPESGAHFSEIAIRGIIVAKPSANSSVQPFRIYKISRPINGKVTIEAQHISYDLTKNVTMPFSVAASATACASTLASLKSNAVESCPFSFWTDVTTVASYSQKVPSSIRQRLGGVEGSVLDQFGGEYEWDNFAVKLHKNRGVKKDITLRYGKNITDLEQEENIANTVTGVVPFWSDMDGENVVTLDEKAVYSSHASQYSNHLTIPLDLSSEWEDAPTEEQLRNKARVYVNKTGFGVPKVSVKVSFVNLADTVEYKNILPLENVSLCDEITVQFETLGIDTTAKIVETVYDVLAEKYISIQVGSLKSTLASTITDSEASMAQTISDNTERIFSKTSDLIDNATAWLTSSGGYVVAVKNTDGTWKELLFMDTNDVTTAHNVLRINENGIGFSSSGVSGPYKQGWTLDGNILIGGSNAAGLTVYKRVNGVDTVLFQIDPNKIVWNTPNSSMASDGTLTLNGGTLNMGGANDGEIYMYDSSGRERGLWNRNKFRIKDSSGDTIFEASGDGLTVDGDFHTDHIDLEDNTIIFDDDSRIEGAGFGNGININSNTVVFSVDSVQVTEDRGDTSVRTGWTGRVLCDDGYIRDVINGIICQ